MLSSILAFSLITISPHVAHAQNTNTHPPQTAGVKTSASIGKALKKIGNLIKKSGISNLPSASAVLGGKSAAASLSTLTAQDILAVSGLPPALASLGTASIEDIFWRPGVVEAIASGTAGSQPEQCQEFFSSEIDGYSGGLGACHMAEGVGRSFQTILNSETSLCYMKNLPTKSNLKAGGITLIKGKFPGNDVSKLFAPGAVDRLVKVNTEPVEEGGPTESIFINIPSKAANRREDLFYSVQIYFCPQQSANARGYNLINVTNSGDMELSLGNASDPFGGGAHSLQISGKLARDGRALEWDSTQSRTAQVAFTNDFGNFKAEFEITSDDRIILKSRHDDDLLQSSDYSITRFSGSDVTTVSFLEGGFKGESSYGEHSKIFTGAAEYRDTYYASSPTNQLYAEVQAFDMGADPFYDNAGSVNIDPSGYSCSAEPDVELSMDGSNATLRESLEPCFSGKLENMDFCTKQGSRVAAALANFRTACFAPDSSNPGGRPGVDPGSTPTPAPPPPTPAPTRTPFM